MSAVQISKVKAWKDDKGYGFILNPTPGGEDIFIHHSGIIGRGRKSLHPGDPVQFQIITDEKGLRAVNLITRNAELGTRNPELGTRTAEPGTA